MSGERRRGLGRGLDALITSETTKDQGVTSVPIDSLEPNPLQPRSEWDDDKLEELSVSIREHGVIQPLIVTRGIGRKPYQIVAGERRWRAARKAGMKDVPVLIRDISSMQALEIALVENVQRADLNPIEEALAFRQLVSEFGLTQEKVAERVGKSRSAIANTLRLLDAPEEIRAAVLQAVISAGHARALLAAETSELMLELFHHVVDSDLNVRQTERLVASRNDRGTPAEKPAKPELSPDERAVQHRLQQHLGTKVDLRRGASGGQIVIHFYSDEELNGILGRIGNSDDSL
ncbi:MAG: ParB/RepB/Spo0J family partition protein [Thermomicrobiales bacterium]